MNTLTCTLFAVVACAAVQACTPFTDADCANMDVDFVADDCDNQCFYTCAPSGNERRCCNPCELWSQDILTCIFDQTNQNCTFQPSTELPGSIQVCSLSPGPNPYTFLDVDSELRPCAVGTSYNQTLCTCQQDDSNPLQMDAQVTCLTFDTGYNQLQGSNGVYVQSTNVEVVPACTVDGGNCGYFNASVGSNMQVPLFANTMDAFDSFSLTFFVKRQSGVAGVQGLVNNGVCGADSSFDVVSSALQVKSTVRNATDATVTSGDLSTSDDVFVHVAVVYDGSSVSTYVAGILESVSAFEGKVKRVYNTMVLGTSVCGAPKYFQGYLDTVSFAKVAFSPAQVADLAANQGKCLPTV